jgi:hypothetical protein
VFPFLRNLGRSRDRCEIALFWEVLARGLRNLVVPRSGNSDPAETRRASISNFLTFTDESAKFFVFVRHTAHLLAEL